MIKTPQHYTSGIHAGSICSLTSNVSLFFSSDTASVSLFLNRKFAEAFTKAQVVSQLFSSSILQPQREALEVLKKTSFHLFKHLSSEELNRICGTLPKIIGEEAIQKLIDKYKLGSLETLESHKEKALCLGLALFYSFMPLETSDHEIENKIETQGKKSSFVFTIEELLSQALGNEEQLLDLFGLVFAETCLNPDMLNYVKTFFKTQREAPDFGTRRKTFEDEMPANNILKSLHARAKTIWKEHWEEEIEQAMSKLVEVQFRIAERIANKIEESILSDKNSLFIVPDTLHQPLCQVLKERKIEIVGPIREPIKARGFLFQIEKMNRVVGHFLGSIHYAPTWIIDNLNSEIEKAFADSNVLGVECDTTKVVSNDERSSFAAIIENERREARAFFEEQRIDLPEEDRSMTEHQLELAIAEFLSQEGIGLGIDFHFMNKAKERGIEIADLESVATHLSAIESIDRERKTNPKTLRKLKESYAREVELIDWLERSYHGNGLWDTNKTNGVFNQYREIIQEQILKIKKEESKKRLAIHLNEFIKAVKNNFAELYATGNLEALLQSDKNMSDEKRKSMYTRNMEMVLNTHKLILEGKKVFAIAGVSHFVGEGSMIDHMQKMGYKITQIICDEPIE